MELLEATSLSTRDVANILMVSEAEARGVLAYLERRGCVVLLPTGHWTHLVDGCEPFEAGAIAQ